MQYTSRYASPLGSILLAADDIGLVGLWFEGQKYFAHGLAKTHEEKELPLFAKVKRWLDIYFRGSSRSLPCRCISSGPPFRKRCGSFFARSPTGRRQHTARSQSSLPQKGDCRKCPHRRSAARSGTTRYRSSFPATGSSAKTAA